MEALCKDLRELRTGGLKDRLRFPSSLQRWLVNLLELTNARYCPTRKSRDVRFRAAIRGKAKSIAAVRVQCTLLEV